MEYFYKGAVSGAFGLLLSHPIDTVKTSIQTNSPIKMEIKWLYRGVFSPLWGMGIEKAIVFGVYTHLHEKTGNSWISGGVAGAAASVVVTPIERIKIIKQTNQTLGSIKPSYLFRGFYNTLSREVPGFSIYFSVYSHLNNKENLSIGRTFVNGGISGLAAWAFIYPMDTVKTRIQSSDHSKISTIIGDLWKDQGLKGFYKGAKFALIRAVILHSGTLSMFELLKNY